MKSSIWPRQAVTRRCIKRPVCLPLRVTVCQRATMPTLTSRHTVRPWAVPLLGRKGAITPSAPTNMVRLFNSSLMCSNATSAPLARASSWVCRRFMALSPASCTQFQMLLELTSTPVSRHSKVAAISKGTKTARLQAMRFKWGPVLWFGLNPNSWSRGATWLSLHPDGQRFTCLFHSIMPTIVTNWRLSWPLLSSRLPQLSQCKSGLASWTRSRMIASITRTAISRPSFNPCHIRTARVTLPCISCTNF